MNINKILLFYPTPLPPPPPSSSMSEELKKTTDVLSGCDARRFRVQVLNIFAVEYTAVAVVRHAEEHAVRGAGPGARWGVARGARSAEMAAEMAAAVEAAWYAAREAAGEAAAKVAFTAAYSAAKKMATKGKLRKIEYVACRSVINDRKMIIKSIDNLNEIPSTPMTIEEAAKVCMIMITFDEESFKSLQQTLPLKLLDYLLGCEYAISFLRRECEDHNDQWLHLMEKHQSLVCRLDLKKLYAKLVTAREILELLTTYSPEMPRLPFVVMIIVAGYCDLRFDVPEDVDEIYNRLLTLEEFKIL